MLNATAKLTTVATRSLEETKNPPKGKPVPNPSVERPKKNEHTVWGPGGDQPSHSADTSRAGKTLALQGFTPAPRQTLIERIKGNRWTASLCQLACRWASKILPEYTRLDPKLLRKYVRADTVLLGRFYRDSGVKLEDLRDKYVPDAVMLEGDLGIGEHLEANIQRIIKQTDKIVMRADGLLETWSFSYQSELSYILSKPELMARTEVLLEDGERMPLERWAGESGLLDRVGPVES